MASRGCPYRCTFCFNNFFAKIPGKGGGKYLRRRSVDNMMGELVGAKARVGHPPGRLRGRHLHDRTRTWSREFLASTGARSTCRSSASCTPVHRRRHGPVAEGRRLPARPDGRAVRRRGLQAPAAAAHGEGRAPAASRSARSATSALDIKLDHILGLPGEPLARAGAARELYTEFPPRRIQTFWLTHLPGVELTRAALEQGEISAEDYERMNRGEAGRFHTRSTANEHRSAALPPLRTAVPATADPARFAGQEAAHRAYPETARTTQHAGRYHHGDGQRRGEP